ncbi:DNA polymerase III beta subunit-like protein [Prauserella shujinwangii]|uniref:DNA polymerase III beta subunit-like protein n=1 Tax=Prauserella shujinwangii TaxID=1453103 RepID=A0A2T0LTW6_9PSEU|nr:MerR family transcriptional regulator [Prauserella shujinwangii]PRX47134.1 DNA polymerase III beta subunit-like protein [Prauserella shujinwangii]
MPDDLSIGEFARRTGLTPSALRFYDDCGVLRPARTDESSGYRFYDPGQQPRAERLRELRAAGLPLPDVAAVLDGSPAEARRVLRAHARTLRERAVSAQAALAGVLRALPDAGHTEVRLGGPELASAVRQVVPSAAATDDVPALACVLLELTGEEVRLVATDRYRLAVRELRPLGAEGDPRELLVPGAALVEASAWARGLAEVTIESGTAGTRLAGGGAVRELPVTRAEFPDYRTVLAALAAPAHRVLTGRRELLAAVESAGDRVVLDGGDGVLRAGDRALPATCSGPPPRMAFDPAVLGPALAASVGPDVLLEIADDVSPVVVRSADQGGFTTLVMPVALPS